MEKYEDLFIIGQGQYGTAYRARDKHDGHLYCIKRIPMSAKDDHAGALREVQLLDSLDHPNIIRYRESFVDKDGALCIVTSFCEEGDLFTRIRKKASHKEYFSEEEVMNMFVQIASAISYIHSKRILHRDLKTQNIFIARGGIIKLGDFGISKVLERTDSFATTVTGTPYYMAPEICTNQPYTYKSDIWSLGCVLYELCTLKHAFAADSLLSLVYQIVRGNFPPIPTDQFTPGLSDLVNRLLARDANTRPSLGEVFKLPYVQRHLDRFKSEEQRRNLKQSVSMSRRRQLLEAVPGSAESDAALTPKQRLERKKALDRERRELEMRVAAISANKNREQAAARKKEMIYGSNVALPGAKQPQAPQQQQQHYAGGFEDDDLPNMGTMRLGEETTTTRGPPTRPGSKGIWDVDEPGPGPGATVNPYAATLPSQARLQQQAQQQAGAAQRPYMPQGTARGSPPVGGPGQPSVSYGATQRAGGALSGSRGGRGGMWDGDDDVLTGTVRSGTARMGTMQTGLQATASAMEHGGGGAGVGQYNNWDRTALSGLHDDMPNMGTVQMTHGPGQLAMPGPGARGLDCTAANRTTASDSPLMGSVNLGNSRTLRSGSAATAGGALGASAGRIGSAGGDQPGSPYNAGAGGASPYRPGSSVGGAPYRGNGSVSSSPDSQRFVAPPAAQYGAQAGGRLGSAGAAVSSPPQQKQLPLQQPLRSHVGSPGYPHEDDEEDGGYSDDFEDDDEDEGVAQQRCRIIQNVEDMASRAYDGRDSIAAVQERVMQTGALSDKARAIRQGCQAQLGPKFGPVYDYLSRVRRLEPPPEEKEVQRRLLEIVGDKGLMQGCFTVDQLVFTEQMYS
ncbi:hypothetical protein Agub_g5870 [Astrephomene gubernaculifera]|uniref:non-specific serine/threonine protein kinase n=1 Tax=Astrephomene gubernaculifera TaxID=47775 RepID=A0AAD3DQ44_9CHLO|nr:hypothetical protein Agub_g5870 [Astrephomene gubernaculifera]